MWVHCPRASNGLLPRRSNLVGYVRWDAQSDQFPPCQTIIPTAFRSQSGWPTIWELGGSVNTTAFVESNRASAVSSIHVFIRFGPAFKVEDWYVRSGGRRHLLSMIRSRWGTGR